MHDRVSPDRQDRPPRSRQWRQVTGVSAPNLTGLRVLLVEDQMIVAMEIESTLREFGCVVVGPIGRLGPAVGLARNEALAAAILDVDGAGENNFPKTEERRVGEEWVRTG